MARDDSRVVWTVRSDETGIRVVMKPARPMVGDLVRFDIKMSYGTPPYRPGGFDYRLGIDSMGESGSSSCAGLTTPAGRLPKPAHALDDDMHRTFRATRVGPHTFSLVAHPGCSRAAGAFIERVFSVRRLPVMDGFNLRR